MSLSPTSREDSIANSYSIITDTGSVVDILDAVQGSVVGLPPSSLNTIEKLSAAISNDPTYFQTIQTAINTKAPALTTYSKTQVDSSLSFKADQSTTYSKTQVDSAVSLKADQAPHTTKPKLTMLLTSRPTKAPHTPKHK